MNYESMKKFVSEHKAQVTTLVACVMMFVVGFGTGKAFGHPNKTTQAEDSPANYSANSAAKPAAKSKAEDEAAGETAVPPSATVDKKATTVPDSAKPVDGQPCIIKGNISGSSKIYHVKGGSSYEKTTPEACFNTEAEAVAAGFRKAKRWFMKIIMESRPKKTAVASKNLTYPLPKDWLGLIKYLLLTNYENLVANIWLLSLIHKNLLK